MMACVLREINERAAGGRVDRINQPERDETVILIHTPGGDVRLLINVGSSTPRMNLTSIRSENPATPPMFCMLMRKHFTGARLVGARQPVFDRVAYLEFECRDELGFRARKNIIVEIMGRYSNIVLTEGDDTDGSKIIGVLKPIDFSASAVRQLIPGMKYVLPPSQGKADPTEADARSFNEFARAADRDSSAEKFITRTYSGIAAVNAREIVYRAAGNISASVSECGDALRNEFLSFSNKLKTGDLSPSLAYNDDGLPAAYSFIELRQYEPRQTARFESVSALIDCFYEQRAKEERLRRRAADILRILNNAKARIEKKTALQREELALCEDGEKYRLFGDLITANIYAMKRGMTSVSLPNYYEGGEAVEIPLSERLTPAQNAQFYYKKYAKSKTARIKLTEQLELDGKELDYVESVLDALSRSSTEAELSEIRAELYASGYASKMKNYSPKKKSSPMIIKYATTDGHTVLCGKNNASNDELTMKTASKRDLWFHVKGYPGSHVILVLRDGEDTPPDETVTEAALIAAHNSRLSESAQVPVDVTRVKEIKKPSGSKPGFVIYHTNRTVFVDPDPERVKQMKT